jgi:predicted dehydrogenase
MTGRPRVGFLGVGWIGRDRMQAIAACDLVDIVAVADADACVAQTAAAAVEAAVVQPGLMFDGEMLDAVVIATPNSLHAQQAIAAFDRGLAVFCQKPLGRDAAETRAVVDAAARADRLLGVDLSYRHLAAGVEVRDMIDAGAIGRVYAADLTFHNAYGPDKSWFLDRAQSGGGCLLDLGTHLVDLARWMLPGHALEVVSSRLYADGHRLVPPHGTVEDYATAMLGTSDGVTINLSCSWFLAAGRDAVIGATFYGSAGAVAVENVDGSFYDFRAVLRRGTGEELLVAPPDAWGGRAGVEWARQLVADRRHRPDSAQDLLAVATVIDEMYAG